MGIRFRISLSREEVISLVSLTDGILVHFERIASVLKLIRDGVGIRRKLLRLPNGDEANAELISQRRSKYKAARFDADHGVDAHSAAAFRKRVDRLLEARRILQKRRNVVEIYARLRKIRDFPYKLLEIVHGKDISE